MRQSNDENDDPHLCFGSLFSGYGGLDLPVEGVFDGRTVWFSEINEPVARVFSHDWPNGLNLGDITTINWNDVEPVDIVCEGFACQDVSTAGKIAGLAPDTRSGLWAHMATATEGSATRVRGDRERAWPAVGTGDPPGPQGDNDERRNLDPATSAGATLRGLEPDPWGLGNESARPLRATWSRARRPGLRCDMSWIGLPASLVGAPHPRFRIVILAHRTVPNPARLRLRTGRADAGSSECQAWNDRSRAIR